MIISNEDIGLPMAKNKTDISIIKHLFFIIFFVLVDFFKIALSTTRTDLYLWRTSLWQEENSTSQAKKSRGFWTHKYAKSQYISCRYFIRLSERSPV